MDVEHVQKALGGLNNHKASGPDELLNLLLKDFSDIIIIAQPITPIINASYNEFTTSPQSMEDGQRRTITKNQASARPQQ